MNHYGDAGEQVVEIAFITEGDVYRLIVHSKLPSAERFEHWVFDEVLPSIRKHGVYMSDSVLEQVIQNPEVIYTLAQELVAEREQLEGIRKQLDAAQPKAAYLSKPDNELPVTPMMEAFEAAYKKRRTKNGKRA